MLEFLKTSFSGEFRETRWTAQIADERVPFGRALFVNYCIPV